MQLYEYLVYENLYSFQVVYVTAVAPYVMMAVFLVRGLTLPGAWNGLKFYLTPDFSKLLDFQVSTCIFLRFCKYALKTLNYNVQPTLWFLLLSKLIIL